MARIIVAITITLLCTTSVLVAQLPWLPLPRDRYISPAPPPPIEVAQATPRFRQPAQQPTGIAALPQRTMTLAEVANIASHNHPGVQQARRQAEAWHGEWIQAGLRENPHIGYSAEDTTRGDAGLHGINFSLPVTPRHIITARQAAISREYQAAYQVYQMFRQKAVNDAMLAAYRAAFAFRKCVILEEHAEISREAQRIGGMLLQAGEIGRAAYLEMQIQVEQGVIDLRDAEIAYRAASRELAILLGLPERDFIAISDSVEALPPELNEATLFAEIRASSPELRQAHAEVDAARARLRQEQAESGLTEYELDSRIAFNTDTRQAEFSAGIAIPLRIFDRNQGNIRRAQLELAAAQRNVERVERQLAQRFEHRFGEYRMARNRVVSYSETILPKTRELLDMMFDTYRRGETTSHELLSIQQMYSAIRVEYLENMNALMESHILLRGALLEGALERPE